MVKTAGSDTHTGEPGRAAGVDQEPDIVDVARHKAAAAGTAARFRFLVCDIAQLSAPPGYFDLVTIGNAFHRLPRTVVPRASLGSLRPGGYLALLGAASPATTTRHGGRYAMVAEPARCAGPDPGQLCRGPQRAR
jgi:hypothetical protein